MTRKLFRLSQVVFNRLQASNAQTSNTLTLNQGLKGDPHWLSLSGTEHQLVGKTIAKHHTYFAMNCPIPVKVNYNHTDKNGRGIYT